MKTVKFIYQDTEINFSVNPNDKNVMINATEMAKVFNKRIDFFLKSAHAKAFIKVLEFTPYGGNSEGLNPLEIIQTKGVKGTYFNRILALKFAAWLNPEFELWVYSKIDEILFGNYKKHWEAHALQEQTKVEMEKTKSEILLNPTPESVARYFEQEIELKSAKKAKSKAIKSQLNLFNL